MADTIFGSSNQSGEVPTMSHDMGCFKEAVCIDSNRIYDSCADKDCLQDLRVLFVEPAQHIIDQACSVRIKCVDVLTAYVDLEPVPFNRGFYSVDMTFFFDVVLDVFLAPAACPVNVSGLSVFNKKVILFGSEGNVKIYSSETPCREDEELINIPNQNLPKASVQIAEPIGLDAKICCGRPKGNEIICPIPENICRRYGGEFVSPQSGNTVYVTVGIFTIVQIERSVQMLVPTYDFCIPEKECISNTENPCDLFSRLDFPTDEFFPPRVTDINQDANNRCCR